MARVINGLRIVEAKLINQNIDKLGKSWAIDYDADGFSMVNVTVQDAPQDIKTYLEGDNSITVYPVASNIDKLCDYALASFPNLKELYLFKNDGVVDINDHLSYLSNLRLLYVASNYLSDYPWFTTQHSGYDSFTSVDDYIGYVVVYDSVATIVNDDNKTDLGIIAGTTIAYDRYLTEIVQDYVLPIPYVGQSTLTAEYMNTIIGMLDVGEKNAVTKVVIPTDFTQASADAIAWGYNFNALPNLNNNIWYGTTQYDFTTYTFVDDGTHILTADLVEEQLDVIVGRANVLTKVIVPIDFASYQSGSINAILNGGLTNLRYIETTYAAGAMVTDLQGDVVAKIISIGKTLDEALVYARTMTLSVYGQITDNNVIIVPPYNLPIHTYRFSLKGTNLVCVYKLTLDGYSYVLSETYANANNLIAVEDFKIDGTIVEGFGGGTIVPPACKRFVFTITDHVEPTFNLSVNAPIEKLILNNYCGNVTISRSEMTRSAYVDFLTSLGTPNNTKTLTINRTDYDKLTADDIAIATAKNWSVVRS